MCSGERESVDVDLATSVANLALEPVAILHTSLQSDTTEDTTNKGLYANSLHADSAIELTLPGSNTWSETTGETEVAPAFDNTETDDETFRVSFGTSDSQVTEPERLPSRRSTWPFYEQKRERKARERRESEDETRSESLLAEPNSQHSISASAKVVPLSKANVDQLKGVLRSTERTARWLTDSSS
jgi:hypothetical protein